MNYYKASQRKDNQWDYTCQNDGHIWPVGYCSMRPLKDCEQESVPWLPKEAWDKYKLEILARKEKYHDHGHATPEEACNCYKEYMMDTSLRLYIPTPEQLESMDTQHKCEVCKDWTSCMAELDHQHWHLCQKHLNRETVEKLYSVAECWSS